MKIDKEVLAVLSRATVAGNALTITDGQLDRALYARTDKVLKAAGGKWNTKAKAHLFAGDAETRIEQILLTGDIVIPQDFGYFPTPPAVVARLVELAEVEHGMRLLEPSAGRGAIASAFFNVALIDAVELLTDNFHALQADDRYDGLVQGDFLELEPAPIYDRVVMNPPFERQADIKHVLHALKFLKPGGLLVSVMAASVSFRDNRLTSDFRALVAAKGGTIEPLPEGSFKASGTMVGTVVVRIPG